jgi:hypothetical protein
VRVIEVEVATQAQLFQLDWFGAEDLARSAVGIVDRPAEVVRVGDVGANLGREEL